MKEFKDLDEKYMWRAIELARMGMGDAAPNPMVGCVIVCDGTIIGEGYHRVYGGPHAEVNAIESVQDKRMLERSVLYVNLEPCAHFGKTPPCCDLIISYNIPKVVVGTVDYFAKVSGRGISRMQDAGIEVVYNVLEEECYELNRRFFTFHKENRPYVILKWAQTLDGFLDIDRNSEEYGQPTWITNQLSKMAVHKNRVDEMAIMVGTNTAIKDNPSLTVRNWFGEMNPLRIVLDRQGKLSDELHLLDGSTQTLIFTEMLKKNRENLTYIKVHFGDNILDDILSELYNRNIQTLIVEGGAELLKSFIDKEIWDEARIFLGNTMFQSGVSAPNFPGRFWSRDYLDDSQLLVYRNLKEDVCI